MKKLCRLPKRNEQHAAARLPTIETPEPPLAKLEYEAPLPKAERRIIELEATRYPNPCETGAPQMRLAKLFACSGSPDTTQYREATKLRAVPEMEWLDARVALNRLVIDARGDHYWRRPYKSSDVVALAEFVLTARDANFQGRKGEHASKYRKEVSHAIAMYSRPHLQARLIVLVNNAKITDRPITEQLREFQPNAALQAMVPLPDGGFVRVLESTAEQAFASLEYMRRWLADRAGPRSIAAGVEARLWQGVVTAEEYAAAISTADELEFMSAKLVMLYSGIAHSVPLYRLYPATSEREAIELWWPWGRSIPLVDGGPAKAPNPRKKVLDPSIITTKRPQDVVREVIELTGINRTTAQRMTGAMRSDMRQKRKELAASLLRKGETRAAVARTVGLSPSRISTMFKGQVFPTKRSTGGGKDEVANRHAEALL